MSDTLSFGSWVKQRRKALDLTQQDLARFVGCSESAILKFESGKRRPSKQITERLARAIGKEVRAHFRADRAILGGIVVRVGDRIFDGSMRRKLNVLRRKMLTGE